MAQTQQKCVSHSCGSFPHGDTGIQALPSWGLAVTCTPPAEKEEV